VTGGSVNVWRTTSDEARGGSGLGVLRPMEPWLELSATLILGGLNASDGGGWGTGLLRGGKPAARCCARVLRSGAAGATARSRWRSLNMACFVLRPVRSRMMIARTCGLYCSIVSGDGSSERQPSSCTRSSCGTDDSSLVTLSVRTLLRGGTHFILIPTLWNASTQKLKSLPSRT
jgi:hypothetical protein